MMIVYIRVYGTINHMLMQDAPLLVVWLRLGGFVDIALLLLGRSSTPWGLGEEVFFKV